MHRLDILGKHPGAMVYGRLQNIAICAWAGQPTGAAVGSLVKISEAMLASSRESFSYVHLLADHVKLPDAAARHGLIEVTKRHERRTACVAIVIGGTGFWASAMRNAVIGIRVLLPRSFEYRLHGELGEVVQWLPDEHRKRTGTRVAPLDLLRAMSEAQEAARAQPAEVSDMRTM